MYTHIIYIHVCVPFFHQHSQGSNTTIKIIMASIQCSKPAAVQQTIVVCHKTTTETCHSNGPKEHSFTDKVKDAAHSATKIFDHKNHQQNSGQHCHLSQKPHGAAPVATATHSHTSANQQTCCGQQTNTTHKKEEGHGGFLHNLGEHIKNLTSKKKHRKNRPAGDCNDSSSSSSDDESDNETCEKKV